jgi:hypothetical protein
MAPDGFLQTSTYLRQIADRHVVLLVGLEGQGEEGKQRDQKHVSSPTPHISVK